MNHLTDEQLDFFEKVKGKRIYLVNTGLYPIPKDIIEYEVLDIQGSKLLVKTIYTSKPPIVEYMPYFNGFKVDETGFIWRLVTSKKSQTNNCTCDIRDIMTYGCKCGGK